MTLTQNAARRNRIPFRVLPQMNARHVDPLITQQQQRSRTRSHERQNPDSARSR
jgi:hypothetical protein